MKLQKNTAYKTTLTALFAAIIVLMSFTPLGYLPIGPLKLTLLCIPLAVSACVLGPSFSAGMGFVFGMTSFIQCLGADAFGTIIFSISPLAAAVVCIGARTLDGWLTGLIYKALSKKNEWLGMIVASFSGAFLNTLFFMSGVYLFFSKAPAFTEAYGSHSFVGIFIAMAGINGLVEILLCTIIAPPVSKAIKAFLKKDKHIKSV